MLLNDTCFFLKKLYIMFLFGKIIAAIYLLVDSTIMKFLMNLLAFVISEISHEFLNFLAFVPMDDYYLHFLKSFFAGIEKNLA
jgi:hypothetical protein